MKTTLHLPDDLMRQVKIRAVHEQKKLKDAIAEFIRKGMTASRTRAARARDCLNRAAAFLQPQLFRVSHQAALDAALRYGTTAYDARFLALAQQLRMRLVTEDAKLRAVAPALTYSLAEAVANL